MWLIVIQNWLFFEIVKPLHIRMLEIEVEQIRKKNKPSKNIQYLPQQDYIPQ